MMRGNRITTLLGGKHGTDNGIIDLMWDGEQIITSMLVMAWEKKCFREEPRVRYTDDGGKTLGCTRGKVLNLSMHREWGKSRVSQDILKVRAAMIATPAGGVVAALHPIGNHVRCWCGCIDPN